MSFLLELLRRLGLEGGAVAAASCVVVAFYLLRARSVGARAASAGAAFVAYTTATLVILAFGLALGWFDPAPEVIRDHLALAFSELVDVATGPARRLFRRLVEEAMSGS